LITHEVRKGDCLLSITKRYKFRKWENIFDHPANKDLKINRSDPMCLLAKDNDVVKIPDKEPKKFKVSTGNTHNFTVPVLKAKFSLILYNAKEEPFKGVKYILEMEGKEKLEGETGGDGLIECDILPDTKKGLLTYYPYKEFPERAVIREVKLGYLDPVESTSGIQARLNYQGYDSGKVDNDEGLITNEAYDNYRSIKKTEPKDGLV
jgi:N-acetylmuramoyl-L-alanine amidase